MGANLSLALRRGTRYENEGVATIADSVPCSAGSFVWTVSPALPDADDYAVVAASVDYPTETAGRGVRIRHLDVRTPDGGQVWTQGSTYPIRWWSYKPLGKYVRLELLDAGVPARTIKASTPNDGVQTWKVPYGLAPGSDFAVQVSGFDALASADASDATFTIQSALRITIPNGGQSWTAGSRYRIRWRYSNDPGARVRIELHKDGVFERTIAARAPMGVNGRGSYAWRVPADLAPGSTYRIRIQAGAKVTCFDLSDGDFTVAAAP